MAHAKSQRPDQVPNGHVAAAAAASAAASLRPACAAAVRLALSAAAVRLAVAAAASAAAYKWRLALPPLRADRPLGPQLPSHRKRDDRSPSITLPPVRRQDSARATHRQAQGWPVGGQVGPSQVRSGPPRPYGVHHRGRCCPRPGRRWRLRGERAEAYIVALCVCV